MAIFAFLADLNFQKAFQCLAFMYRRLPYSTSWILWSGTWVRCLQSMASWSLKHLLLWLHFPDFFFGKNLFICLFVCLTVKEYFYIFVVKTFGNTKGGGKKKNHSQWHLLITTVNSSLFSLPSLILPFLPPTLIATCSILAETNFAMGINGQGEMC